MLAYVRPRVHIALRLVLALVIAGSMIGLSPPSTAKAKPAAIQAVGSDNVTADSLPTVQIDGVVWTQVVVGNTVYAGGEFRYARPAAATSTQSRIRRWNLLAYDIRTGRLVPGFAPKLNGMVRTLAASSDGKTLLVGGDFTKVGSTRRSRFAAFTTSSGALTKLAPSFDGPLRVISTVGGTVYVGGSFTKVKNTKRSKLAAVRLRDGKLLAWRPTADGYVRAMTPTPDRKRIIVGGAFKKLNGKNVYGMGSLDASTGKSKPWKINATIRDYGTSAAIMSLTADATTVYGAAYAYRGGNFEGAFAANPSTGAIKWVQDCHGDTYDITVGVGAIYSVGHAHNCSNIGGFGETRPLASRALAVSTRAAGTVATSARDKKHVDLAGRPSPALLNWFPDLTPGTYTGQSQAAWSVESTKQYVLLAGEFTKVNGVGQQGLARFAVPSKAPRLQGPVSSGLVSTPTARQTSPTTVALTWKANWDRDDTVLTYRLLRDGEVIQTRTVRSQFWNRPQVSATDTELEPGSRHKYQVVISDPSGNSLTSGTVTVAL